MSENIVPYGNPVATHPVLLHEQKPKIKDVEKNEIIYMVSQIVMIAGLPGNCIPENTSSFPHATFLVKMIRELFGSWSTDEVVYAFKLAVMGTLKCDLKIYGSMISTEYIGQVMRAYAAYKHDYKMENKNSLPMHNKQEETTEISEEEKKQIAIESFTLAFEQYTKHGIIANYGDTTFRFLQKHNLFFGGITESSVLNDAKSEARSELDTQYANAKYSLERGRIKDLMSSIDKAQNLPERHIHNAMIRKQFEKWENERINVKEIIKNL